MQEVEVFTLSELVDRLLILQGQSLDDVWREQREALYQQLQRAADSGKLRVRHPETMLPEVFAEWPQPSSGCLVCTIADVNTWLASEGVPYSMMAAPEAGSAQESAPSLPKETDEWVGKARKRGAEIIERQRAKGLYPSQIHIADEIAKDFRAAGIVGAEGKPLSGETIKRHALKGITSAVVQQLSTQTGQSKRSK